MNKKINFIVQILLIAIIFTLTFTAGCSKNNSNYHEEKSWAFSKIIILNGETYVGTSDDVTSIDKKIGTIKYFSTRETNINNTIFSNYYEVGTNLYSIPNVSTKDAIAVEISKNQYIKAINKRLIH
ncbi:hypothetical protein V6B95_00450 [Thermoanaerobacterium saccharolyticum]|uniref:hypothetical protein n=1 Tax=Thermoanaerobacterium saccharolyticum TaxID=28896 RepID=UPI0005EFF321